MFSVPYDKIKSIKIQDKSDYFYASTNDNEFPIRRYIEKKYGYCPSFYYCDDEFSGEMFQFLKENGSFLSFTSVGKLSNQLSDLKNGIRGGTFWFYYKDVYIRISLRDQPDEQDFFGNSSLSNPPRNFVEDDEEVKDYDFSNKTFTLTFIAPICVQKYPIEDFEKFIVKKPKGRVHIFIRNQYGDYEFEPIKLEYSNTMDLELNYGKDFLEINNTITKRLKDKPNGLYMFHGLPGTGKTTYIKHLANVVDRDFIYVPTNMLEYFTTDPASISSLLRKPNSVLILEDAEKVILKRENTDASNSSVSSLLNLSDGIMSDIVKTAIILTYNCPKQDIDDALKRKGRLQMDYEFKLLSKEDSIKLAQHLKYPQEIIEKEITDEMSLADIYNLQTKVDFYEKKNTEKRVIGFGS